MFIGLLTGHDKSCGWEVFDVPITPTGARNELLARYGEIALSDIKAQEITINSVNDRWGQEEEKLYTFLIV